ncbi:hypothetical protein K1719_008029 [Acacia pycnantha]|nr:hypothetical protein K1719_008029 [Acacia pycnantha]
MLISNLLTIYPLRRYPTPKLAPRQHITDDPFPSIYIFSPPATSSNINLRFHCLLSFLRLIDLLFDLILFHSGLYFSW